MKKTLRQTARKGGGEALPVTRRTKGKPVFTLTPEQVSRPGTPRPLDGGDPRKGVQTARKPVGAKGESMARARSEAGPMKPEEKRPKVTEILVRQWEGPVDEWKMLQALLNTVRRQIRALNLPDAAIAALTGLDRSYVYKIRTTIKVPSLQLILRWFNSQKVSSGFIIAVHEKALRQRLA